MSALTPGDRHAKTHISAEQAQAREDTWFLDSHEDSGRAGGDIPPARSRSQEVDRQQRKVAAIAGFPKRVRILRSSEFRKVYDNGARFSCPLFTAFLLAAVVEQGPHIGITTPRALGCAVIRNRIKRRVREAVRACLPSLSPQWYIVINPRRRTLTAGFPELLKETERLFQYCNGRR